MAAIPDVNFTISHNGIPEPGVSVEVDSKKIVTSATGKSLFIDLPAGNYNYTVSKEGFNTITNEIIVSEEDMEINLDVSLVSALLTDSGLIQVYPNPSNGKLFIEIPAKSGIAKIDIFNDMGLLVYSQNNLEQLTNIDLGNLTKGIYLISLSGENKKIQIKQVIN